jgi:hypothetical protein
VIKIAKAQQSEEGTSQVQGQPGLHSESEVSLGNLGRLCVKIKYARSWYQRRKEKKRQDKTRRRETEVYYCKVFRRSDVLLLTLLWVR